MRGTLLRVIPGLSLMVLFLVLTPGVALAASVPAAGSVPTPTPGLAGSVPTPTPGSTGSVAGHEGTRQGRQMLPATGSVVPASGPQAVQGPPPFTAENFVTDNGYVGGHNLCRSDECNNRDPGEMRCNTGKLDIFPFKVLDANQKVIALGYNIYSYACNANWAEGRLDTVGADAPQGHNIVVSIWTKDSSGAIYSSCFPALRRGDAVCDTNGYNGATGWPAFSKMVDGSLPTQAGVQAVGPDGTVSYGYKQK